jgi:O-antigen/teichoic acid export membrane protein
VAVLAGAYTNAIVHLAISHLQRGGVPYSFLPRRQLVKLVGRFSVPIYVNATMLFAAMQGDRMVVAAMFSKRELALYTVACTVGQGFVTVVGKVSERLLLPIMAVRGGSIAQRRQQANRIGALMIGGSFVFLVVIAIVGPGLVHVIYGPGYTGLPNIVFAAAIFQMIQMQQSWLNSLLMSNGLTAPFPTITAMRAVAFPAAILFVSLGLSLVAIPLAFALGAGLSLAVSYYAARPLGLVDKRLTIVSFILIVSSIVTVAWLAGGWPKLG